MPELTSIAAEYASALAHPMRFRLVAVLADGPRTLIALASELDAVEAVVAHHLEALRDLGFVDTREHADGSRSYELLKVPVIWDHAYGALPVTSRRASAAAALMSVSARATAAVDRGGFDREDIHLTRTTLTVDEERWGILTKLFGGLFHELGDMAEQPDPEGETFRATAALMLFTSEHAHVAPVAEPPSAAIDARVAADGVLEEFRAAIDEATVDWEQVATLAEQMRLIARGAKNAPSAAVIPLRRD